MSIGSMFSSKEVPELQENKEEGEGDARAQGGGRGRGAGGGDDNITSKEQEERRSAAASTRGFSDRGECDNVVLQQSLLSEESSRRSGQNKNKESNATTLKDNDSISLAGPKALSSGGAAVAAHSGVHNAIVDLASNRKFTFPWKLFQLLEDVQKAGEEKVVSWLSSGKSFKVHDRTAFVDRILPIYFRQKSFKSFQRQLYIYGFDRISSGPEKGGYHHPLFLRGQRELTFDIQRVSAHQQQPSFEERSALISGVVGPTRMVMNPPALRQGDRFNNLEVKNFGVNNGILLMSQPVSALQKLPPPQTQHPHAFGGTRQGNDFLRTTSYQHKEHTTNDTSTVTDVITGATSNQNGLLTSSLPSWPQQHQDSWARFPTAQPETELTGVLPSFQRSRESLPQNFMIVPSILDLRNPDIISASSAQPTTSKSLGGGSTSSTKRSGGETMPASTIAAEEILSTKVQKMQQEDTAKRDQPRPTSSRSNGDIQGSHEITGDWFSSIERHFP